MPFGCFLILKDITDKHYNSAPSKEQVQQLYTKSPLLAQLLSFYIQRETSINVLSHLRKLLRSLYQRAKEVIISLEVTPAKYYPPMFNIKPDHQRYI